MFKNSDRKNCMNYQGITILSTTAKTYEWVGVEKILQEISELQLGSCREFRKGRGVQDHIQENNQLKKIQWKSICSLSRYTNPMRINVEEFLKRRVIYKRLYSNIKRMYKCIRNYTRTGNSQSKKFTII